MLIKQNVSSGIYKLKTDRFPYKYDLNIYKGCSHGCRYCYARCTYNKYYPESSFISDIYVKENIAEVLDKELGKKDYTNSFINIGGVCDSYQPIERECGIMREVLKVFIKHKQPILFSTKSDLVTRDIDLISELSNLTKVIVGFSITTADEEISKKIESGASTPLKRYEAMKRVKSESNAVVGLHIFPILPYLTDLETIFKWGKESDVDYVLTAFLHLRGEIRSNVLPSIKRFFPELYPKYLDLYVKNSVKSEYKEVVNNEIRFLRKKYGLERYYPNYSLESKNETISMF